MSFNLKLVRTVAQRGNSPSLPWQKAKEKKQRSGAKYLQDETSEASAKEVAEKTLNSLGKLGTKFLRSRV